MELLNGTFERCIPRNGMDQRVSDLKPMLRIKLFIRVSIIVYFDFIRYGLWWKGIKAEVPTLYLLLLFHWIN